MARGNIPVTFGHTRLQVLQCARVSSNGAQSNYSVEKLVPSIYVLIRNHPRHAVQNQGSVVFQGGIEVSLRRRFRANP